MELYRPFLSYAELGGLVEGRPSDMYDALQAILGLDQLVTVERRLAAARRRLDEASKQAKGMVPELLAVLQDSSEERAREVERELGRRSWDLERLDSLAVGEGTSDSALTSRLQLARRPLMPAESRPCCGLPWSTSRLTPANGAQSVPGGRSTRPGLMRLAPS